MAPTRSTVTKHRHGQVTSADLTKIDCGKRCIATFVKGTLVELTATPKAGFEFKRWTGDCTGSSDICVVRVKQAKSVGRGSRRSLDRTPRTLRG